MRLIVIAAALALAGCASNTGPTPQEQLADARLAASNAASDRDMAAFQVALDQHRAACLALHPAPPRTASQDAIAQWRTIALDCYQQRAAAEQDRLEARELRRLEDLLRELDRDAAMAERARAQPPLGSASNPLWIRPTR